MLISLSKRFVFISNSKTASTSFETVLDPYAEIRLRGQGKRKHATWAMTRDEFSFLFDHPKYPPHSFFRFGVIRDPVDWFVSWYNYRLGLKSDRGGLPAGTTFEQYWLMNDWTKQRSDGTRHLQKAHFLESDGSCTFDLVMPMDMLGEYQAALFARLGVDERLPVSNKSRTVFSSREIPAELAAEMRDFWREDYEFIELMRARIPQVLSGRRVAVVSVPPVAREESQPTVPGVDRVRVEKVQNADGTLHLRGSVICAPTTSPGAGLHVRAGEQRIAVQWLQSSPNLAKKFPGNPHAARARFTSGAFAPGSGRAELYIDVPGREPQLLGFVDDAPSA